LLNEVVQREPIESLDLVTLDFPAPQAV